MRIQGIPYYLDRVDQESSPTAFSVRRFGLEPGDNEFSENWLQQLIHDSPEILPASTIEPAFSRLIPVCMELPCPSGYLDNLYVTPDGYLVLVECKLWRNPESRRKVIAQIMDYAKDFASWDYDDLNSAIRKRCRSTEENPLFSIADADPETLDEISFVDRVSRNLKLGRHMLLIVGDGIQENMIALTSHVQQHIGLNFTLGLVELGVFQSPVGNGLLIIPNVLAKTVNIERAVVRVEGAAVAIEAPNRVSEKSSPSSSRGSITEEEFFETLDASSPGGAKWLKELLESFAEVDITYDVGKSLILRFSPDGAIEFGLGFFDSRGQVHTGQASWKLLEQGRGDLADQFIGEVAAFLPGGSVRNLGADRKTSVQVNGKRPTIDDFKGKEKELIEAFSRHVARLREAFSD